MPKNTTYLIKSSKNKSFGTAFCIDKDENGSFLLTCEHVVEACGADALEINGHKALLQASKVSHELIDLAVVYVEGLMDTSVLELCVDSVGERVLFEIEEFKPHKKESFKLEKLNGNIKKVSEIYAEERSIHTYELSLEKEDRIEKGYSGSAVVLKGTNKVIAVATDRNQNGKDAYAIPIAYLKEIWEEMPKLVTCESEMRYKGIEKISFWKKLENQALNTVGGVIVMAVLTGFIYDYLKPKELPPTGLTDKSLVLIIKPYQDDIAELKEKLKNSHNDEEKIKYITLLEKANDEKAKKDKEIAKLKELIENAKYKIVKEATVVFEKEGIEKALVFLQNSSTKDKEKLLKENMKEMAEKHRFEAQLLLVENRYDEAKQAYKKALQYDSNVDTLFDYAYFLQSQNYFTEAITTYEKLLIEQRALAKSNPKVYNADVATTLNNLANLYYVNNQMQKAEESYGEALALSRALAKSNPKVYNADVADTLNNLALLYSDNNQMQKAEEAYGEALALYRALAKSNPKVYNADVATTLNNLANLYSDNNQMQKAEEAYGEALALRRALAKSNPKVYNADVADTLNNLASLYYAQQKYAEAIVQYEKVIEINPKNDYAHMGMGMTYFWLGNFDEAIRSYTQAIKFNPSDSSAYSNLFELQLTQNQFFNQGLEEKYRELFQNEKEVFIKYEMLKTLQNISQKKEANLEEWKEKYKSVKLAWGFNELDAWVAKMDEGETKRKLKEALEVFKAHKND